MKSNIRIAILDLYDGTANEGMRCIKQIVGEFTEDVHLPVECKIFDVRGKTEVPGIDYDIYISSGGPGSPLDSVGSEWERQYFELIDNLKAYNEAHHDKAKHVLLICHSFQIFCRHYGYATVSERRKMSFGVMPVHKTMEGHHDPLLRSLGDPFWGVDSREYQILDPDFKKIEASGAKILCIEKFRPHVHFERAIMGIRFNEFMIGLQFHPEADAEGMKMYFQREDKRELVIAKHGEKKFLEMIDHLDDPDKILATYHTIIPRFLAIGAQAQLKTLAQ